MFQTVEPLFKHLYLVLQVGYLIALGIELLALEFELSRLLLFLG